MMSTAVIPRCRKALAGWPTTTTFILRGYRKIRTCPGQLRYSSSDGSKIVSTSTSDFKLWEYSTTDGTDQKHGGVWYSGSTGPHSQNGGTWSRTKGALLQDKDSDTSTKTTSQQMEHLSKDILGYFLPAHYPTSVAPGYARFATFCFTASVAGSASMVLSTQTLLLAVGVVGSNVQQAGIMAGAFNWVMKDFMGQLGGVVFASQMGKTRAFDTDPKRWRMVAAMALDGATLLEILSPLFPSILVLPVASVANVGKNIGFLTASASRAALHQAVAITGNLGDVTAKAGSQSIMASLIGTSLGIGMSSLLAHDTYNFALGFCVLGMIHQGCNYLAVQSIPLAYFNRQRLYILLDEYIKNGTVMPPKDVAARESFFPFVSGDAATHSWLSVGSQSLDTLCPTPMDLQKVLEYSSCSPNHSATNPQYILQIMPDGHAHLMFFQTSTGEDMIRGMYHACLFHHHHHQQQTQQQPLLQESNTESLLLELKNKVDSMFPDLLNHIHQCGWKTETDITTIEYSHARRLVWKG